MVIGLGRGRDGTVSLSKQLRVTHELKPLVTPKTDVGKRLDWMKRGDVSFYNIYLAEEALERGHKVVCLKRDREDTIRSLLNHNVNWPGGGKTYWEICFPQFNFRTLEGCGEYWDWYGAEVDNLSKSFPIEFISINELKYWENRRLS